MKLVQVLLLNVATVVIALVVYDRVRSETFPESRERASAPRSRVAETAEFEGRLLALETARRESMPSGDADPTVFEPADAGEGAATASEQPPDASIPAAGEVSDPVTVPVPGAEEIRQFRRLQEAVRREDSIKRNESRVNRALDKLSFRLTKSQRTRIHAAFADFEPRVKVIWDEAKSNAQATVAAGGKVDRGEIVSATTEIIQTELAGTLTDIVDHDADAEAIAEVLMPKGR